MARARRKREENANSMEEEKDEDHWEGAPHDCPTAIRRAHAMNEAVNTPTLEAQQVQNYQGQHQNFNNHFDHHFDPNVSPQVVGMGMLAPGQIQLQLQMQQQQTQGPHQVPWLMDDNALLDLDMNALDGDTIWEGWDDVARDFQIQSGQQVPDANTLGGVGNWW